MSNRTATTFFLFPRPSAALPYPKHRRYAGAHAEPLYVVRFSILLINLELTPLQLETYLGTNLLEVSTGRDFGALQGLTAKRETKSFSHVAYCGFQWKRPRALILAPVAKVRPATPPNTTKLRRLKLLTLKLPNFKK